jgi:excisionase family DNA binding protein
MAATPTTTTPHDDGLVPPTRALLVTVAQAAEILSLSRSSIYQLIWTDQLTPIRIGRSVRFSIDQIEQFVEDRSAEGQPRKTTTQ